MSAAGGGGARRGETLHNSLQIGPHAASLKPARAFEVGNQSKQASSRAPAYRPGSQQPKKAKVGFSMRRSHGPTYYCLRRT